jgi:cell division septum initiation protein DivIVA
MSEANAGNPSVTDSVQPVAEQPAATSNSDLEALKAKLELVQADNQKKGKTNQDLNERLAATEKLLRELEAKQTTERKTQLADQGEWKSLWEESETRNKGLEARIAELEASLANKDQQFNAERLKTAALGQIAQANALNPEHVLTLLQTQTQLKEIEGKPVVMSGGAAVPLDQYLNSLKQPNSGWEQYFSASGSRGMGATASATVAPGMTNPYKTRNLTEALLLERDNPQLAEALKAEALRG